MADKLHHTVLHGGTKPDVTVKGGTMSHVHVTRGKRLFMGSEAPRTAQRLRDLEQILDNQLGLYKAKSQNQVFTNEDVNALHKLAQITQTLEQQYDKENKKLNAALDSMTPEELALAEQQAREVLGLKEPDSGSA